MKILIQIGLSAVLFLKFTLIASAEADTAQHHYQKGIEYAMSGQFENAAAAFRQARENPRFESAAGSCLSVIGDALDRKIKSDTAVHFFKGTDFINKNRINDAITEFTLAIFINLKCADAYNSRGYAYGRVGKYAEALNDYSKAIDINPDFVDAYNGRGNIYCKTGEYNRAIEDYTTAIRIRPKHADAYNNRGFVYLVKLKEAEKGCADLDHACRLGGCHNYQIAKQKGFCRE